jgi:hypothetical protein
MGCEEGAETGRAPVIGGSVSASVPGGWVPGAAVPITGSSVVKAVVVSIFVLAVSSGGIGVGAVDPGFWPRIVEFAADAPKFVFAGLDTDREQNAAAVGKFSPSAWPTFYVISSKDEAVLARFVGAATIDQFHEFLDSGRRAAAGTIAENAGPKMAWPTP